MCLDRLRNPTRNTEQVNAVVTLLDFYSGGAWSEFFGRDTDYIAGIFHNFLQASQEGAE
jgi:hypothetical protein